MAKNGLTKATTYILALMAVAVFTFPVYYLAISSFKSDMDIVSWPPTLIPWNATLENYRYILNETPLLLYMRNSMQVAVGTTVLSLVLAVLGGYALARFRLRGRELIANLILFAYIIPPIMLTIPLWRVMVTLRLIDTHVGLVIIQSTYGVPFGMWMMRAYFEGIPLDIEEAAMVDGCSKLRALWRVIVPLSLPGLAGVATFVFILSWSDLLFPMIFINTSSLRTIQPGLLTFMQYSADFARLMAASWLVLLPVFVMFMIFERYLVSGLTAGAVKG
jgi:multiple sugar transport system permease protein